MAFTKFAKGLAHIRSTAVSIASRILGYILKRLHQLKEATNSVSATSGIFKDQQMKHTGSKDYQFHYEN